MATADHEPEFARTLADAQRRWKDEPPITISLPRGDAWLLLTAAQLRRHDRRVDWDLGHDLERVGRVLDHHRSAGSFSSPPNCDAAIPASTGISARI